MRHMRWVIVIGCLAILGIAFGGPLRVQSSVPEDFGSVVILATNSIQIKKLTETDGIVQISGDVVVNEGPNGPTLGATQLVLEKNVTVGGNVKADSITIKKSATVAGVVFYNTLSNQGTIGGSETPLDLPVFEFLPLFQTGSPGTADVVVPANGSESLPAGSYRDIVVGNGATLNFVGGFYEVRSISAGIGSRLTFDLLTEVTVADKLKIEKDSFLGPETGAPIGAEDIVFYVDGINGTGGGLQEEPLAAEVGNNSQIQANIWARNGTLRIAKDTAATGAFLARDVQVEKDVTFELATFFRNRPPVANPDSASTLEDQAVDIDVLANDRGVTGELDPSSVTVLERAVNGPTSVNSTTGEITYTPIPNFNGGDSLVYEVCDDAGLCDTATVTINVSPVNDAPVADGKTVDTTGELEGQEGLIIRLTGSDVDGDTLMFSIVSTPTNGTLGQLTPVPPTSADVEYTPDQPGNLEDSFTFQVDDGNGATDTAVVQINPGGPPPPVIADDVTVEMNKDTLVTVTMQGSAPDGVELTFSIVAGSGPPNGTLSNVTQVTTRTATVDYTPNLGYTGQDSFEFQACGDVNDDGDTSDPGECDTATATINVEEPAGAPGVTANDQEVSTPQDTPVAITLTAGSSGGGGGGPAAAAQSQGNTLFDDEATFLEQLESPTTFNFETESGFPYADPFSADVIGLFAGIYFDAKTYSSTQATSGVQTMTGNGVGNPTPTFTQAIIDFTDLENKPSAFGFFALDLTDGEVIEVTVDFTYGPDQVFDAQLMLGDPEFTPTFLGVIAEGDMIESLTLRGTEAANRSAVRAWLIDDLTIGTPSGVLTFSMLSLPFSGTLIDSNENPITCTTVVDPERGETKRCVAPVAIPGDTVTYTPAQGFAGLDGFEFQSDDGIVVSTANVSIVVGVVEGSCETDPSLCDNGRP